MFQEMNRRDRLRLSAESELDVRTIDRAEQEGIKALRSECDRERLKKAAARLRIALPESK
jgi:hypothetical protein